jgi:hypothetical protein
MSQCLPQQIADGADAHITERLACCVTNAKENENSAGTAAQEMPMK